MALTNLNRKPSAGDLRTFGLLLGPFFALAGVIFALRAESFRTGLVIWALGAAVTAAHLAVPAARRPVFLAWNYAAYPIGWVVSHAVMAFVYFGVFTPIGFLLRHFGGDPLDRDIDPAAGSYWVARDPEPPVERYFRQF